MSSELVKYLAELRLVVGYLGEREQFGWWQSSFFIPGADAFLSPLFPRTQLLAQCSGVTQAAARVHDERIGVGNVYHLFRLPEEMEQSIHSFLQDPSSINNIKKRLIDKASALRYLREISSTDSNNKVGPIRIGSVDSLRAQKAWQKVGALYLVAFEKEQRIFPYFSDIS
jgi:hypothetical protein